MRVIYLIPFLLAFLFSCQSEQTAKMEVEKTKSAKENVEGSSDFKFPELDSLENFPNTAFVITLDQDLPENKNTVYAATIAYCWDEVKKKYKNISIAPEFNLLNQLHQFDKHTHVLNPDEYQITVTNEGELTTFNAKFQKTLPFEKPMTLYTEKMQFGTDSALQFGFDGYDAYEFDLTTIQFYAEDKYSLRMVPLDKDHEILLYYPGKSDHQSFTEAFIAMNTEKEIFLKEAQPWKKYFQNEDEVRIPVISFHLKAVFTELLGNIFTVDNFPHQIQGAWQRNAFVLNENGAKVESEAEVEEAATEEEPDEKEKPEPKYFHFNKPFYVFLKRRNADYPYFAVFIRNTELLQKK